MIRAHRSVILDGTRTELPSSSSTVARSPGVQAPGDNGGLVGAPLRSLNKPAPGKLVDLDPDQQSLSQVIGVALNLTTASGAGFQGVLGPCNLQDMWPSAPNPEGDAGGSNASSIFVSTLNAGPVDQR